MAAVVNSKQTNAATQTITTPTAGNVLVVFASQGSSIAAPTFTDTAGGSYTVGGTSAIFSSSASSIFMAYKVAAGTETGVSYTSAGTGQGICYFELSGVNNPVLIETSKAANNGGFTSNAVTTAINTNYNNVVLAVVALTASQVPSAWTGSKVMTNVNTATTFIIGGSYVASAPLTAQTFQANWTGSRNNGSLVYAFEPTYTPPTDTGLLAVL